MTIECNLTAPPEKAVFVTLAVEQRLLTMFQAWSAQTKSLILCDNQLTAIRNWKKEHADISKSDDDEGQ